MRAGSVILLVLALATSSTSEARQWTDRTGKYRVEAEFVELSGGYVVLRKPDGATLRVRLDRLATLDQQYAKRLAATAPAKSPADQRPVLDAELPPIQPQVRGIAPSPQPQRQSPSESPPPKAVRDFRQLQPHQAAYPDQPLRIRRPDKRSARPAKTPPAAAQPKVFAAPGSPLSDRTPSEDLPEVTYAMVAAEPEKYVGRQVEWVCKTARRSVEIQRRVVDELDFYLATDQQNRISPHCPLAVSGTVRLSSAARNARDDPEDQGLRVIRGIVAGTAPSPFPNQPDRLVPVLRSAYLDVLPEDPLPSSEEAR